MFNKIGKMKFLKFREIIFYSVTVVLLFFSSNHLYSVHHHIRISPNLLKENKYLWKNRLLIIKTDSKEKTNLKNQVDLYRCEINNRKLKIFTIRSNNLFDIFSDKKENTLNIEMVSKVMLIGYDGMLKFEGDEINEMSYYFDIIDTMPVRKTELEKDETCD